MALENHNSQIDIQNDPTRLAHRDMGCTMRHLILSVENQIEPIKIQQQISSSSWKSFWKFVTYSCHRQSLLWIFLVAFFDHHLANTVEAFPDGNKSNRFCNTEVLI